ncbi:MAG: DndE family protein [Candidatus Poribacteria bacterium]|nr:DndE family protein [Candidatus Poribacteria bacterium]
MEFKVADLSNTTFRTTRASNEICRDLTTKLGWRHRYVAARLAIARSLSLSTPPSLLMDEENEDMATPLRGTQLFGDEVDSTAWLALITQRAGDRNISRRDLQAIVSAHWKRGAELLSKDWENAGGEMAEFVARLADLADFTGESSNGVPLTSPSTGLIGEVHLSIGEVARDSRTGENVDFALNAAGGSPHIAIMGGVGSGKTRTAIHILKDLHRYGNVPLLVFDFKGDLAEKLAAIYEANVLSPPDNPIPLDVLHVASTSSNAIKMAASHIRDSIAAVKSRSISGVQSDILREAVTATLQSCSMGETVTLQDLARSLEIEYEERRRKPDELTATLNELTQFKLFVPNCPPDEFFAKSWIVQLPQDSSEELRRLIINLTLSALDRWLNSQLDAPTDDKGIRALRQVTLLDEAHVVLRTKLPALANLVRMSRSKGGVIMLASQSPDDFEGTGDDYLDNMGLTLAFNTQAKPGPAKRIFGNTQPLTGLNVGEALCRIRSEAKTRKIVSWEP